MSNKYLPYQYPNIKYAPECMVQSSLTVSKNEYNIIPRELDFHTKEQARITLAAYIADHNVETNDTEWTREYRLRVLVFTTDQFYEIVENEVQRRLSMDNMRVLR